MCLVAKGFAIFIEAHALLLVQHFADGSQLRATPRLAPHLAELASDPLGFRYLSGILGGAEVTPQLAAFLVSLVDLRFEFRVERFDLGLLVRGQLDARHQRRLAVCPDFLAGSCGALCCGFFCTGLREPRKRHAQGEDRSDCQGVRLRHGYDSVSGGERSPGEVSPGPTAVHP